MAKVLIAYFSRAGENYVNGDIKNLPKGNTEIVAEFIRKAVGGDLFKIETVMEYPADYTECTIVAKDELHKHARPELKSYLDSVAGYDTIFLGYPCWWSYPPMAVATFLERCDFAGKKIILFTTHEGSGFGSSLGFIKKIVPDAEVKAGLAVHGAVATRSESEAANFAKSSV